MVDLQVFVNGERAEIGSVSDFKLILTKVFQSASAPTVQEADHSYEITFPYTKKNALIFGSNLADVGTTRKFNGIAPFECYVIADGVRIFNGILTLNKAGMNIGFAVTLFGDNIQWVQLFSDKSLRDIQSLPDCPFTGDRIYGEPHEPVGALKQRDIWPLTADETIVWFPLVAYGNYPSSTGTGTGLQANFIDDVHWLDVPPAMYIVPIIKAMFKDVGYRLAGGWLDTAEAKKLIIAYTGDTAPRWNWGLLARANVSNNSYDYNAIIFPSANVNYDFTILRAHFWRLVAGSENWDYSDSYFDVSPPQQYIVPVDGSYRFHISTGNVTLTKDLSGTLPNPTPYDYLRTAIALVIVPDDSDELLALQTSIAEYIGLASVAVVSDPNVIAFYDFGTGYQSSPVTLAPFTTGGTYSQVQTGTAGTPGATLDGTGTVTIEISDVSLTKAMRVSAWLVSQYAIFDPVTNQTITFDAYELDIKETSYPDELELAPLLPDMPQINLFRDIMAMHDLCYSVDQQRKIIRIETWDEFYRDNQLALDWTSKGDDSRTPSMPMPFYQTSKLQWSADDADHLHASLGVLQWTHTETNAGTHAIRSTEIIEPSNFAPTFDREFKVKIYFGTSTAGRLIIPCMASDSQLNTPQNEVEWDFNYKPRILKAIGMQAGDWDYMGGHLTEYPAARFSFDETIIGNEPALPFSSNSGRLIKGNGAIVSPIQNRGLFEAHWKRFFAMRPFAHVQEVEVLLNAYDFASIDPSLPILFHGIHYWIYDFIDGFDPVQQFPMKIALLRQV